MVLLEGEGRATSTLVASLEKLGRWRGNVGPGGRGGQGH